MRLTTHFGSWHGLECAGCSRRRISFGGSRNDYLWARDRHKDQHAALHWVSGLNELTASTDTIKSRTGGEAVVAGNR
jgi:hypothetical protein